ncbi:MAG: PIN domain-containing protein [Pseudomonadota bacterium]|nr:PIN domain-containing protein [Pseudomonadota bacterium]
MTTSITRPQYICIDWENVQPEVFPSLQAEHIHMLVFVGAQQGKLSFPVVEAVQKMGSRAQYVKVTQTGNNSLDMHMAFYIGRLSIEKTNAYFHIIAKDRDYDPLIQHLKDLGIGAKRYADLMDIEWIKHSKSLALAKESNDFSQVAIEWLQARVNNRPASVQTLKNTLKVAALGNSLDDTQAETVFNELVEKKYVVVHGSQVIYPKF